MRDHVHSESMHSPRRASATFWLVGHRGELAIPGTFVPESTSAHTIRRIQSISIHLSTFPHVYLRASLILSTTTARISDRHEQNVLSPSESSPLSPLCVISLLSSFAEVRPYLLERASSRESRPAIWRENESTTRLPAWPCGSSHDRQYIARRSFYDISLAIRFV